MSCPISTFLQHIIEGQTPIADAAPELITPSLDDILRQLKDSIRHADRFGVVLAQSSSVFLDAAWNRAAADQLVVILHTALFEHRYRPDVQQSALQVLADVAQVSNLIVDAIIDAVVSRLNAFTSRTHLSIALTNSRTSP